MRLGGLYRGEASAFCSTAPAERTVNMSSVMHFLRMLVTGIFDALYTFYLFSGVNLFGALTVSVCQEWRVHECVLMYFQVAAALSAVQPTSAMSVVQAIIWVDLHLLSFEVRATTPCWSLADCGDSIARS